MTHITCRLTAENRDQLRNPTLGNRVWDTFAFLGPHNLSTGLGAPQRGPGPKRCLCSNTLMIPARVTPLYLCPDRKWELPQSVTGRRLSVTSRGAGDHVLQRTKHIAEPEPEVEIRRRLSWRPCHVILSLATASAFTCAISRSCDVRKDCYYCFYLQRFTNTHDRA